MIKRRETVLLVENWRRFISEGNDQSDNAIKALGNDLKKYLNAKHSANISKLVSVDTDSNVLKMLSTYLRTDEVIKDYREQLSNNLLQTFSDLIERAPEIIENLKTNNDWTVAGKIAPMLQKQIT